MNKDYYQILGINKDSTESEIKQAFRKKSLECHPDKNGTGDDSEFKLVNDAYTVLSDKNKKHAYDHPEQHQNIHADLPDIFKNFFNTNGNGVNSVVKKQDHMYEVKISLKDVHFGTKKTLKIKINKKCFDCRNVCKQCNGNGTLKIIQQLGPFVTQSQVTCNGCNGKGIFLEQIKLDCICKGTFVINSEHILEIDIQKNINNGERRLFEGLGEQINNVGEKPGNLIVTIIVEPNDIFSRELQNLIYRSKITLAETLIGKEIIVPHFDGDIRMNINIFGIINQKKRYSLKNKGLNGIGDLTFEFEVIYPEKVLSENERNKLRFMLKDIGLL
jgi:DnaJ-class molecular chaperone